MKIVLEINLKKEPKCDTCGELAKNAKRKFTACGSQISWCEKMRLRVCQYTMNTIRETKVQRKIVPDLI